jgi:5-methylcytosine-specific restriction endonuclease McrA
MPTPDYTPKQCTRCKEWFPPTEEYFRLRRHRNQLNSKCRTCEHERDAELRSKNKDKRSESQRRFRERNPERSKEIKRKWAENNPDKVVQKNARYYIENRDVVKSRNDKYNKKHPEKKRARVEKRRKLSKQAEGNFTENDLKIMYEEQEHRCAYCGITIFWNIPNDIHIDHIQPLSKGGSNWPNNLCLACADCNLSKGEKSIEEWMLVRIW